MSSCRRCHGEHKLCMHVAYLKIQTIWKVLEHDIVTTLVRCLVVLASINKDFRISISVYFNATIYTCETSANNCAGDKMWLIESFKPWGELN